MSSTEVVVALGTRAATLAGQNTRWRAVVDAWARDPAIGRLTLLDYPTWTPRQLGRRTTVTTGWSWLPGVPLLDAIVPLLDRTTPLDALVWRRTARAVARVLGPAAGPRVVVAATPLWLPLLDPLRERGAADRVAFDAVDDWRLHPGFPHLHDHLVRAYRQIPVGTATTAVSPPLAAELSATRVPNGVDLAAYEGEVGPGPEGLPDKGFAVYVGVVEDRVDLALVAASARVRPTVVAGPCRPHLHAALHTTGAHVLGRVHRDVVPGLLRRAGVGLLPHRVDAFTASMDPMKLLEYLAAGLPVVATPAVAARDRVTVVAARDTAAWEAAVAGAPAPLGEPDPQVRDRDWSVVAAELRQHLLGL